MSATYRFWEKEAAQADADVDRVILSNHARAVLQEARKAAAVLAPLKSALASLWAETTGQVGEWIPAEQASARARAQR